VSLFVWALPFDLSGMGGPTSNYITAGIALQVTDTYKPPPPLQGGDTFRGETREKKKVLLSQNKCS